MVNTTAESATRVARGRPVSSVYDEEFISLDLTEEWGKSQPLIERPHPKG